MHLVIFSRALMPTDSETQLKGSQAEGQFQKSSLPPEQYTITRKLKQL
jgi:hypothetical protein